MQAAPRGGFDYSSSSSEAREIGLDLLRVTAGFDGLRIPRGIGVLEPQVLALVARARHLLRRAYDLADLGDAMASAILIRSITESVFTLAWLNKDPELASTVWMLDEIRSRLSHHKEVATAERRHRRRARAAGEPVRRLEPGESLGLLTRQSVRALRVQHRSVLGSVRQMQRVDQRLEKLKVRDPSRIPGFRERATVGGAADIYSLTYRFDSNSAAHPNPLALEQFLDADETTITIRGEPQGPRPDPYAVAAVLLCALLDLARERLDLSELEATLIEIKGRLARLSQAGRPAAMSS